MINKLKLPGFVVLAVPLLALAATSVRQEFAEVVSRKPDAAHGAELFAQCTACHGADAGGVIDNSTPRIAGQHYRVLVRQLVDFRRGKRWDYRMEDVATNHDTIPEVQDIADVAWFVSRLDRDGAREIGDGQYVERGARLYAAGCAGCHGAQGEGDDIREIPRLSGQHAAYLARQIYDAVDGRRLPLTRSHRKRFAPFAFEDVAGLTDFLARIGWQHETTSGE
ncbi:MAG: c-type cytochrome [Pseudomonadota bacterium]